MKEEGKGRSGILFLAGLGVGALAAVFLDPISGARRRSYVLDKTIFIKNRLSRSSSRLVRRLSNSVRGVYADFIHGLQGSPPVSDETLSQRVRSAFGHKVSHAHAIVVDVAEGVVVLSGPVLAHEAAGLVNCVKSVPGVKDVINKLQAHRHTQDFPSPQSRGKNIKYST